MRKAPISHHGGGRQTEKLHLVDEDELLTMDNSRQIISIEDNETPLHTVGQEIIESCQPLTSDKRPKISSQSLKTRHSEVERTSKIPAMAASDGKSNPRKASSAGHGDEPADKPSSAHIQRENFPSNHFKEEVVKPKTEGYKLHLGPSSTRCRGNLTSPPDQKCLSIFSLFFLPLLLLYPKLLNES